MGVSLKKLFFVAKARQAISCLHEISFAGRKNIEKLCFEMSASYNRVGDSLLGCNKKFLRNFLLYKNVPLWTHTRAIRK